MLEKGITDRKTNERESKRRESVWETKQRGGLGAHSVCLVSRKCHIVRTSWQKCQMESQRRSSVVLGLWTNIFWKCNNAMLVHSSLLTRVILTLFAASHLHLACSRPVSNDHQHHSSHGRRGVYEGLSEQSQIDGTVSCLNLIRNSRIFFSQSHRVW